MTYDNQTSTTETFPVAASAPGIFTMNSSGSGQGAILNQDYSVNSPTQPAAPGSIIMLYATGGGALQSDSPLLRRRQRQRSAVSGEGTLCGRGAG